ncbi:hypothetical protein KSP39_PZI010248 [Platanthera zijinensis]|uniref:Uncharacterized protein n=1 Tax=Platanthera zijinensis TaxID=2320716 RepID=A0AAP0G6L4_9ASPA
MICASYLHSLDGKDPLMIVASSHAHWQTIDYIFRIPLKALFDAEQRRGRALGPFGTDLTTLHIWRARIDDRTPRLRLERRRESKSYITLCFLDFYFMYFEASPAGQS